MTHAHIVNIWCNSQCEVAWQCPWCRCPGQQVVARFQHKGNSERWVLHHFVGVVHACLGIRQRSFECPRVRQHTEALVNESLVPQGLKRPHHAFHIRRVERLVIVCEIHPAGLASDVSLPIGCVLQYRNFAIVIELVNAVIGNCLCSRNSELTLCFGFCRQSVTIPTEATLYSLASHGLIARNCIFNKPGEQVPIVRKPVSKRWTVVKHKFI